jgi:hypothetical protein
MANKTIPQLPEQTGKTDNDLLAIVDSGETVTSKIKVSTLLSGVGGAFQVGDATDSIVPSYSPTSRGADTNTTYVDKLNLEGEVYTSNANETFNLVQGNTTITNNPYNRAFAGHGNSRINSASTTGANMLIGTLQGQINQGSYHHLMGMGTIGSTGNGCFMAGSEFTSFVAGGSYASIVGGSNNTTNGNSTGIFAGGSNNISNTTKAVILGGTSNAITGRFDNAIVAGNTNSNAARYAVVVGGQNNQLQNGSQRGFIGGGIANTLNEGLQSAMVGGNSNDLSLTWNSGVYTSYNSGIYHDQTHGQDEGFSLYNAANSYIRQTAGSGTGAFKGGNSSIFNSWTCDIAGQSGNETYFATIIGSESSQITGGTRGTVLIGCSGRTGLNSHTTYVETLEAFTHVVLNDYSNLNFANDSAAATGGVPLGGLYHTSGAVKVRIT